MNRQEAFQAMNDGAVVAHPLMLSELGIKELSLKDGMYTSETGWQVSNKNDDSIPFWAERYSPEWHSDWTVVDTNDYEGSADKIENSFGNTLVSESILNKADNLDSAKDENLAQ